MNRNKLLIVFTTTIILGAVSIMGCSAKTPKDKPVKNDEVVETLAQTKYPETDENIKSFEIDKEIDQNTELLEDEPETYEAVEQSEQEIDKPVTDNKDNNDENVDIKLSDESTETTAPKQPIETNSMVGYNDRKSWWFKRNSTNTPPSAQMDINISQYGGYYLGNTEEKTIYLTFDEGYENGYTSQILDILKDNDVKAAFFVTKPYIESEPELVKRMVNEGHVVGNHSDTHPDMTTITDEQIVAELTSCSEYFEEVTETKMPPYFRPPEGVYSIRTLEKVQEAGYNTIFWSYAYKDWDTKNQPGKQAAFDMAMNNYHNGSIMLLHAVSQSNTEALDDIIKNLKEKGYSFASLDELP